jgi:hypothetical protein
MASVRPSRCGSAGRSCFISSYGTSRRVTSAPTQPQDQPCWIESSMRSSAFWTAKNRMLRSTSRVRGHDRITHTYRSCCITCAEVDRLSWKQVRPIVNTWLINQGYKDLSEASVIKENLQGHRACDLGGGTIAAFLDLHGRGPPSRPQYMHKNRQMVSNDDERPPSRSTRPSPGLGRTFDAPGRQPLVGRTPRLRPIFEGMRDLALDC